MGLVELVIMFAPAIGPTISGVIVQYLGWRFLYICVIPFSLFLSLLEKAGTVPVFSGM